MSSQRQRERKMTRDRTRGRRQGKAAKMARFRREGIPFTQYLMPDGRTKDVWIKRPPDVADLAFSIYERGFRFECEMLSDYRTISLTVVDPIGDEGEPMDVDGELAENGPSVPEAVDRLIRRMARPPESKGGE